MGRGRRGFVVFVLSALLVGVMYPHFWLWHCIGLVYILVMSGMINFRVGFG